MVCRHICMYTQMYISKSNLSVQIVFAHLAFNSGALPLNVHGVVVFTVCDDRVVINQVLQKKGIHLQLNSAQQSRDTEHTHTVVYLHCE